MNESNTRKPLHELSNMINSLFFTLEQVQSSKKIDDQDVNNIINHCINRKAETIQHLNTLRKMLDELKESENI